MRYERCYSVWSWRAFAERSAGFPSRQQGVYHIVGSEARDWFPVKQELRQGSVIYPWFINEFMDGVTIEVNANVLCRGLELFR